MPSFCTQIGNERFTWFGTRPSKSRLNFLDLLRAGHTDFVLNDAAFDYMRGRALSAPLIARLAEQPQTTFADQAGWTAHLDRLGFNGLTVTPDPVQIATEGAIWGSIHAHDFLQDTVALSDDAGQFAVGHHALCWVHAERLVHKLDAFTDHSRAAQQRVRKLIWHYYAALKAYRANPGKSRRLALRTRFDRIFRRRTGFVTLDRLLARLHANKDELLMVLDRPDTPKLGSAPVSGKTSLCEIARAARSQRCVTHDPQLCRHVSAARFGSAGCGLAARGILACR